MILYCQDCGHALKHRPNTGVVQHIVSYPDVPLAGIVYDCPACGCSFHQCAQTLDDFVSTIAFPPSPVEAA